MNTESAGSGRNETDSLAERRAAFLARVTAAATHEFRNILAIVKESSGLVEDLVDAAGDGPPKRDKIGWALGRIRIQIERGSELSTSLNRVMHGLDHPRETVALADAIQHAGSLAQRFARQQRRTINVQTGDLEVEVTMNALDLYRGLVAILEWCVARVPEGETVAIEAGAWEGIPVVRFHPEPAGSGFAELEEEESSAALQQAAADLPASIRYEPGGPLLLVFDGLGVG